MESIQALSSSTSVVAVPTLAHSTRYGLRKMSLPLSVIAGRRQEWASHLCSKPSLRHYSGKGLRRRPEIDALRSAYLLHISRRSSLYSSCRRSVSICAREGEGDRGDHAGTPRADEEEQTRSGGSSRRPNSPSDGGREYGAGRRSALSITADRTHSLALEGEAGLEDQSGLEEKACRDCSRRTETAVVIMAACIGAVVVQAGLASPALAAKAKKGKQQEYTYRPPPPPVYREEEASLFSLPGIKKQLETLQRDATKFVNTNPNLRSATAAASDVLNGAQRAVLGTPSRRGHQDSLLHRAQQMVGVAVPRRDALRLQKPAGFDWGTLAVILAAIFTFFASRFLFPKKGKKTAGRKVRDRSLGGKEIVVADSPTAWQATPTPKKATPTYRKGAVQAPRPTNPLDVENVRSERARMEQNYANYQRQKAEAQPQLPSWWAPPKRTYVSADKRQEGAQIALRVLKRIMDARVLGQEMSKEDLVSLNAYCLQYNVSLNLDTPTIRDTIYRTAAELAVDVVASGQHSYLISTPQEAVSFICSLSEAISVPDIRASTIVQSTVAARVRSLLLQAAAFVRQQKDADAYKQMRDVSNMFSAFPTAAYAPELEMCAESLGPRITAQERRHLLGLFFLAGGSRDTAEMVGAALGLDSSSVSAVASMVAQR